MSTPESLGAALAMIELEILRKNASQEQDDWRWKQGFISGLHRAHSIVSLAKPAEPREAEQSPLALAREAAIGAHKVATAIYRGLRTWRIDRQRDQLRGLIQALETIVGYLPKPVPQSPVMPGEGHHA